MRITVQYETQVKRAAGIGSETLEVVAGTTVGDVLRQAAGPSRDALRRLVFGTDNDVLPTLLLFVNDRQIDPAQPVPLQDGDTVTIMSPISGG